MWCKITAYDYTTRFCEIYAAARLRSVICSRVKRLTQNSSAAARRLSASVGYTLLVHQRYSRAAERIQIIQCYLVVEYFEYNVIILDKQNLIYSQHSVCHR